MALFYSVPAFTLQATSYSTDTGDEAWLENMEGKVNATINVLTVIKDEIEKEKKSRDQTPDASDDDWAESFRKNIRTIKRLWAEIQKMEEEENKERGKTDHTPEETRQWTNEMKTKLDKSIKAMQVLKEELDSMEQEEN
jgi:hypothetical protein